MTERAVHQLNKINKKIKENSINEWKGNLFEYLVAAKLSQKYQLEHNFIHSIPASYLHQLTTYEQKLKSEDLALYKMIPSFADLVVTKVNQMLKSDHEEITAVHLIGKLSPANIEKKEELRETYHFHEGDIVLSTADQKKIPISLKFCKENSYVNTKNGGISSFLAKYFASFGEEVLTDQQELNAFHQHQYQTLGHQLFSLYDIEPGQFLGQFDQKWDEHQLPHLPGELSLEGRELLFNYYSQIISFLYQKLQKYFKEDTEKFMECLFPICGFGNKNIWQIICFHHKSSSHRGTERSEVKKVMVLKADELKKNLNNLEILSYKKGLSSFEIRLQHALLQIRVKPMNKFSVPGLKINCSIKFLLV